MKGMVLLNFGLFWLTAYGLQAQSMGQYLPQPVQQMSREDSLVEPINRSMRSHQYVQALEQIEAVTIEDPAIRGDLMEYKFQALLHTDEAKALAFARQWEDTAQDLVDTYWDIGNDISQNKYLEQDTYAFGARAFEGLLSVYKGDGNLLISYDLAGRCYFRAGDRDSALVYARKSLASARDLTPISQGTLDYLEGVLHHYEQAPRRSFVLTGTLKGLKWPVKEVYLKSMADNGNAYRAAVKDGRYEIRGTLDGPTQMNILPIYGAGVDRSKIQPEVLFVYLEPDSAHITHSGRFGHMTVSGSAAQQDFDTLQANGKYEAYIRNHPDGPMAVYALRHFAGEDGSATAVVRHYLGLSHQPFGVVTAFLIYKGRIDPVRVEPLFKTMPALLQESTAGRQLAEDIEWGKLDNVGAPYRFKIDSLGRLYEKGDTTMPSLESHMRSLLDSLREQVYAPYIVAHPGSPIALPVLAWYTGDNFDNPARAAELFALLPDSSRESKAGKAFARRLMIAQHTAIGATAPFFSETDTAGRMVSLSSFKGRYLLLDFWASWCHPCRMETPHIAKAWNRFHDKGFDVLSVSLDTDRDKWMTALREDHMVWNHVSALKGLTDPAAVLYDILGIPANLLIGPDGKIIAKNLAGEDLEQELTRLIK